MQQRAQEVLNFWFGPRPHSAVSLQSHMRLWFGDPKAPELIPQQDELIRERFGALVQQAMRGALAAWESSPRRRLALILLLDQFPRNIHRGSGEAFAGDSQALALAASGMQIGADAALDAVERIFFYMPLQHAEAGAVQEESLAAFRRLRAEAPTDLQSLFDRACESAALHCDIVMRFGRFPHRNRALGRDNTPEEERWLITEGESFGQ
jgi:uncharacterized protein (DUF924 family)